MVLDGATGRAVAMTNDKPAPHKKNKREPRSENNYLLRDLKAVKLVLKVMVLTAQLIKLL